MSAAAGTIPWSLGGLGELATAVGTALRVSPAGVLISGVLFPSELGDGTLPPEILNSPAPAQSTSNKKTKEKTKDATKTRTCNPAQDKSCKKDSQKHSGRIQGQEDKITYVPAAVSGSAWNDWPNPPNLLFCTGFATACRAALRGLEGAPDRGKAFQAGADVAYTNLVAWMGTSSPAGVSAKLYKSFYFNGKVGGNNQALTKLKGKDSRRIDFDVIKGEALKG
jgi:hypothetical protein